MKRFLFLLLILSLKGHLFALYMGNPALPGIIEQGFFFSTENWFAVKTSYERDWVFDRDMKAVSSISGRMDDFEYIADQGLLIFNIIDRIEIYGSGGAMRISASHIPLRGVRNEYETHDQFTWGIGGRGLFAEWGNCSFGIDVKYQRAHPTIKWMTQNGTPVNPRVGSKISFHEWQVGLGVSYQVALFYPYIAVKYSNAQARFKHLPTGFFPNTRHFKVKNRRKFGMAIGTTLSNGSRFDVSVEARIIDEQAITLAAQIKF